MLAGTIIGKSVEPIARRAAKVIQRFGGIEHLQPVQGSVLDVGRERAAALSRLDKDRFPIGEGADHEGMIPSPDRVS